MSRRDLDGRVLDGVTLPQLPRGSGRWPAAVKADWLEATAILLGRGVDSPARMARLTGVTRQTCERLIDEVKAQWAAGVTSSELNWRREALFHEAHEVTRHAWDAAEAARENGDTKGQSAMLKIVLAGNARKAKLLGADTTAIQIRSEIKATVGIDLVAQVESDFGLAAGALEQLGKAASVMFSEAARAKLDDDEDAVIDVDFSATDQPDQLPQPEPPARPALAGLLAKARASAGQTAEQDADADADSTGQNANAPEKR